VSEWLRDGMRSWQPKASLGAGSETRKITAGWFALFIALRELLRCDCIQGSAREGGRTPSVCGLEKLAGLSSCRPGSLIGNDLPTIMK